MCSSNSVEVENNFVMECQLYGDLRDSLFQHISNVDNKFNTLCQNETFHMIMKLGDSTTIKPVLKM